MPYGIGRMMRLRLRGGGMPGCPRSGLPLGRGLLGTAVSIAAGLALNDLTNPDGLIRGSVKKLISKSSASRLKQKETKLISKS